MLNWKKLSQMKSLDQTDGLSPSEHRTRNDISQNINQNCFDICLTFQIISNFLFSLSIALHLSPPKLHFQYDRITCSWMGPHRGSEYRWIAIEKDSKTLGSQRMTNNFSWAAWGATFPFWRIYTGTESNFKFRSNKQMEKFPNLKRPISLSTMYRP